MSKTTHEADARNHTPARGPAWMERLVAIDPSERELLANNPKLRREVRFQAMLLVLAPLWLGFATFRVALDLLGYSWVGASALAAMATLSLFAIDQHQLVQARRNPSKRLRRSMHKVRAVSLLIICLGVVLLSADTLRIEAIVPLLKSSSTAWLTIAFWLLVGALPEFLMLGAQRRTFMLLAGNRP